MSNSLSLTLQRIVNRLFDKGLVVYRAETDVQRRTVRIANWHPWIILLLLVFLNIFTPERIWQVLIAGWLLILAISTWWTIHTTRRINFERNLLHSWGQVGDRMTEEFAISSDAILPLLALEIEDHSDLPDYNASALQSVRASQFSSWRETGVNQHRGLFRLGPTTLRYNDPFRFFSITWEITSSQEVLIHPPILHDLDVSILPGGGQGERIYNQRSVTEMASVSSVRKYAPGDPVYRIHWPLSVRHQEFMVKEFDRDTGSDIWLVLDLYEPDHRGEGLESSIESAISWAASLAWSYLERGHGVGLAAFSSDRRILMPPVRGAGQIRQVIRALAPLQGQDRISISGLLEEIRPHIVRGHSMVVITPSLDARWVDSLTRPSMQRVEKEVVLLDAASFDSEPVESEEQIRQFRSLLEGLRIPVQVVKRQRQRKLLKHLSDTLQQTFRPQDKPVWRELSVASLVLALLFLLPKALADSEWLAVNDVLWWAAVLGGAFGFLLSRRFSRSVIALFLFILVGLLFVIQFQGKILPGLYPATTEIWQGIQWLTANIGEWLFPLRDFPASQEVPAFPEWLATWDRLSLYIFNLRNTWSILISPRRWVDSDVLSGSILGLIVWLSSAVAVWSIAKRRSAWGLAIPIVSILALNVFYNSEGWGYLFFSTVASMLLLGDSALRYIEDRWTNAILPIRLQWNWWKWSGAISAIAALAMATTYFATDPELGQWLEDTFSRTGEAAAGGSGDGEEAISSPAAPPAESPGVWPRGDLLGAGPELSDEVVMTIQTPGIPQADFYWRATSFDDYTGRGWKSHAVSSELSSQEVLLFPVSVDPPANHVLIRQTVKFEDSARQIYAADVPVRLSQPAEGRWVNGVIDDLASVYGRAPLFGYEVLSWVPVPSADILRDTVVNYPTWVRLTYLEIPEDTPERVVTLAQEITADAPTVYDKAIAIQTYLRQFEYSTDLPEPPEDRDIVDYFLFDLQKGYCDYFATAMVVLARSVDIPARLAVGYATGEYDQTQNSYIVTGTDAHSWVEIYFDYYGWIRFEPTPGFPPEGLAQSVDWEEYLENSSAIARAYRRSTMPLANFSDVIFPSLLFLGRLLVALAILVVLVIAISPIVQVLWLRSRPATRVVSALYKSLLRWAKRMGIPLTPSSTPDEIHAELIKDLQERARSAPRWGGNWSARMSLARLSIHSIITTYRDSTYSPRPATEDAAKELLGFWYSLTRTLWGFWLLAWRPANRRSF
nr:DUF58 domain-containing protein [Anaerolineae bacterium]